jgi:hypothetical protein
VAVVVVLGTAVEEVLVVIYLLQLTLFHQQVTQ